MKKVKCISCKQEIVETEIDKTRTNWKKSPLCKSCSERIYRAYNGD